MTTFNTNTDVNARGRQMMTAREAAETQVWRLVDLLPALFTHQCSQKKLKNKLLRTLAKS